LEAARVNLPEIYKRLRPVGALSGLRRKRFLERVYPSLPSVSIDYGIMEKTMEALMVAADFSWDDLGSWEAVGECLPCPGEGNRFQGKVVSVKSGRCVAITEGPLIGLVGVKDLVVVATKDAVLVCPRSRSQEVRDLIAGMKSERKLLKFL
jgi:mannose-1-phosphate guanylyltransferase